MKCDNPLCKNGCLSTAPSHCDGKCNKCPKTCPDCHGTGTKPEPEHTCPICGTVNNHCHSAYCIDNHTDSERDGDIGPYSEQQPEPEPEPEPDEIMRQFGKCWHGVFDHLDEMLLIEITDVFRSGYKSGYTSRNAEIERHKNTIANFEKSLKRANKEKWDQAHNDLKTIDALKAEIESLRCCGNCDNLRATPQDHDFCWNNNGNLPSERICKYWTRKTI